MKKEELKEIIREYILEIKKRKRSSIKIKEAKGVINVEDLPPDQLNAIRDFQKMQSTLDAEKYFEIQRRRIKKATSVNEILEIMSNKLDKRISKDQYRSNLRKEINRKFKGDLEKTRDYFIKQINIGEHNYFDIDENIKNKNIIKEIIIEIKTDDLFLTAYNDAWEYFTLAKLVPDKEDIADYMYDFLSEKLEMVDEKQIMKWLNKRGNDIN